MSLRTPLIEAHELAAQPSGSVLVVDCRFDLAEPARGGRDYRDGHIPGAVYANLDGDLSDLSRQPEGLGRHPLPREWAFSALLSRWGWRPGLPVVAYDGAGGALAAARLWWLLKLAGVAEAAVLDGGWPAWLAAGLPVSTDIPAQEPTTVSLHFDESQQVDHETLARLRDDPAHLLLDARAAPRYRGEVEPIDPVGGHVPGALNRPFADNLGADGRFKAPEALRADFLALLGGRPPQAAIHMCGSGVTACHNLLAMEAAGLAGSRLYAPSWSGWLSDPARPVARG
jgi:thiosulfate/3-mercaptopyruvate sulfurtransferase